MWTECDWNDVWWNQTSQKDQQIYPKIAEICSTAYRESWCFVEDLTVFLFQFYRISTTKALCALSQCSTWHYYVQWVIYLGTRPQHILLLVLVKHLVQNEIQPNQKCFVKCTNNRAASIHWISVGFWTTITKFGELNACIWFRMAILGTSSIYKCNVFSFLVRSIIDLTYSMSETFKNLCYNIIKLKCHLPINWNYLVLFSLCHPVTFFRQVDIRIWQHNKNTP